MQLKTLTGTATIDFFVEKDVDGNYILPKTNIHEVTLLLRSKGHILHLNVNDVQISDEDSAKLSQRFKAQEELNHQEILTDRAFDQLQDLKNGGFW